jgi:hypothetical protein
MRGSEARGGMGAKGSGDQSSWPGIAVRRTASLPLTYVPAVHVLHPAAKNMDAQDKPGHDGISDENGL